MSVILASGTGLVAPSFALIGALAGAALGGGFSIYNASRQSKHDTAAAEALVAEQRRLALTERSGDFLASTYHAVLSLRDLAIAAPDHRRAAEKAALWPTIDRVNKCLVAVEINDDKRLSDAANDLDKALRDLARDAKAQQFGFQVWSDLRDRRIGDLPEAFKDVARELASKLQTGKAN